MKSRASILVALLWCVAMLAVIVVGALHTARVGLETGKNFGDRIQARYLALAGVEKAEALLYREAQERSHGGSNHTGGLYDDAQDFREVALGRGTYSVLRRGRDDEGGGVFYGVSDEASRLNVNSADQDELTKIPGLDATAARAILGWRGQGSNGVESEYYLSLRPPYQPREAPFETIRELLMVRGVTPGELFGQDAHLNGRLDDLADEASDPPQYQEVVDSGDLGWAGLLTVDSSEKNVNAAGEARVNLQSAAETSLAAVPGIDHATAHAIVAYRERNRFESIANLLDVTPPQDGQNSIGPPNNPGPAAGGGSGGQVVSPALLMKIADDVTVADDQALTGLINVNTASLDVLACLPGMDRDLAQKIIAYRQSSGFFANPAELMKVDGVTPDRFKQVASLVTARAETFCVLAEGKVKSTGARQRIQVIVQVNLDGVRTLAYREDDL